MSIKLYEDRFPRLDAVPIGFRSFPRISQRTWCVCARRFNAVFLPARKFGTVEKKGTTPRKIQPRIDSREVRFPVRNRGESRSSSL